MPLLFLLSLLLFPSIARPAGSKSLRESARLRGLSRDPQWRALLHFRRGLWGDKSGADGGDFFLSPRGKTDPAAELDATLTAFFDPPLDDPEKQSPQCRFPARYEWLREKLSDHPGFPPPQACPRLDKWLSRMDAAGVSLVYASSYLNNPASMYGHTFLRLEPGGARAAEPLLAYSVNFSAETDSTNGLVFAVKGLVGGYPGRFATHPYYMKVQQYTNMESRDLWEYDLHLSSAALRRLTLHVWELGTTWFDYFFFTENCSYQLLPLLEAADPSLDLSGRFNFKAIPSDTLRAVLESPGLAGARMLRPSQFRAILARRALLDRRERRAAETLARGKGDPSIVLSGVPPERRALVLDSAHDFLRYRHGFARYPTPEQEQAEQRLLVQRGIAGGISPDVSAAAAAGVSPPESSHRTGRIGVGGGRAAGKEFVELSLRGAMHDLEEDPAGFIPGSRLEMVHPVFRVSDGRVSLHRFTAVDIFSLAPMDPWFRRPSWGVSFGLDTPLDRDTAPGRGLIFRLKGGSGAAWGTPGFMGYGMLGADAGVGGLLDKAFRLAWTPEGGVLLRGGPGGLSGAVFHRRYFWGEMKNVSGFRGTLSLRLSERWEARGEYRREGPRREAWGRLQLYL